MQTNFPTARQPANFSALKNKPATRPHTLVETFLSKFTVLNGAARELWLAFALKLLNFAAYAVTNLTLKRWLSTEFGYSDQQALGLVAAWSISMTIVTLLVGALTDAIGLRKTFFLGVWICILARAVMVFAPTPWFAIAFGLFPLAVGEALGTPVLVAAVRKYSTTPQRSISFSASYMMVNFGSLAAAFIFDWVRQGLGERGHLALPLLDTTLTTYRTLFLVSCLLASELLATLGQGTVSVIVKESLTIGGWVAMWRPLEIYLYDWWPVRDERRVLERLSRMSVRVEGSAG